MTDIKLSADRIDELIQAVNELLLELLGDRLKSTCVSIMVNRRRLKDGSWAQTSDYIYIIWNDERGQQKLDGCVNDVGLVLDAIRLKIIGPPFNEIARSSTEAFLTMFPDVEELEATNG